MTNIRAAAVAGLFYSSEKAQLRHDIQAMLETAQRTANTDFDAVDADKIKALIVPHAGYIYSGPVAASAYQLLQVRKQAIKRVILLGPVHLVPVRGLALPEASLFSTPLGKIKIDSEVINTLSGLPQVKFSASAHEHEHSLEVQLPFLQTVLGEFTLLPLAVGDASTEEVAAVLEFLWGGSETLIVISSDLSHFLDYEAARITDAQTVQKILNLQTTLNHQQACGGTPVNGLLRMAQTHQLQAKLLDLQNSGDTAGDKKRVVGYASFAFLPATSVETNNAQA